jgi:hypothetical protein
MQFTARYKIVHGQGESCAVGAGKPARPRRQTLRSNVLLRERYITTERFVVGQEFEYEAIDALDVRRLARKRDPAEWRMIFAKRRR